MEKASLQWRPNVYFPTMLNSALSQHVAKASLLEVGVTTLSFGPVALPA